jgi:hypothetical protein
MDCARTAECDIGACSGSRIHRRGCIIVGEYADTFSQVNEYGNAEYYCRNLLYNHM